VIKRAIILAAAFCILSILGGRQDVGFLSGSEHVPIIGALYFLAWFGVVLVVPILLIASLLRAVHGRIAGWISSRRP